MRALIIGLVTTVGFASLAGAQPFVEGEHYIAIDPPQPTRDATKVEVVEVFSYACPHCANFQPFVEPWADRQPDNVDFHRMPVIFRPNWEPLARAYYVADILGEVHTVHMPIFDAMHKERRNLFNPAEIKALFAEKGIDEETYESTARSFAVETRVRRGDQMARRYAIQGTPSLIVNGKWRVSTREAGGYEKMLEVVDYLIEQESAAEADAAQAAES